MAPNDRMDRDGGAISGGTVTGRSMMEMKELRFAPRVPRRGQPAC